MNIFVVFYSEHGHIYQLAESIDEGAQSVDGASVEKFRTAELTMNPYGASVIVGPDGILLPNETEIGIARLQGLYVAEVTKILLRGTGSSGKRQ